MPQKASGRRGRTTAGEGEAQGAADVPDGGRTGLAGEDGDEAGEGLGFVFAEDDNVGVAEGGEGLAQIAGGQEDVVDVFAGEQDDVEIARELAVLEAVVEQVHDHGGAGIVLRHEAGLVAVGADVDGDAGALGEQEGFVAEAGCVSLRVYAFDRD